MLFIHNTIDPYSPKIIILYLLRADPSLLHNAHLIRTLDMQPMRFPRLLLLLLCLVEIAFKVPLASALPQGDATNTTTWSQLPRAAAVVAEPIQVDMPQQLICDLRLAINSSLIGPVTFENSKENTQLSDTWGISRSWLVDLGERWLNDWS